jgi:NADH dehydrogenase FAD-containing subunit
VWAIGDAAVMQDQRLPATAQGQLYHVLPATMVPGLTDNQIAVANQKAKYIVKKLNKIIKNQNSPKQFEFHNQGSLAYIGNWFV